MSKKQALNDWENQGRDENTGYFQLKGDEKLANPRGVRLPESIDRLVSQLPPAQRSVWMRRVLVEAALRELSGDRDESDSESEAA